jgi:hypothetical protein
MPYKNPIMAPKLAQLSCQVLSKQENVVQKRQKQFLGRMRILFGKTNQETVAPGAFLLYREDV